MTQVARPLTASRIAFLDTVRGTAMLFVVLSHLSSAYLPRDGDVRLAAALEFVSMIASPTFILISGLASGILAEVLGAPAFDAFRGKLRTRAIFLLVVVHPLLGLAGLLNVQPHVTMAFGRITDVVALSLVVGPWLVQRAQPLGRSCIAAAIYGVSWLGTVYVEPKGFVSALTKQSVFGLFDGARFGIADTRFSLLPWFAVYLIATVLGTFVGRAVRGGASRRIVPLLGGASVGCVLLAVALFLWRARFVPDQASMTGLALSPWAKFPPGPVYLLLFGGAGLGVLALALRVEQLPPLAHALNPLRDLGQASVVVYVLQTFASQAATRLPTFGIGLWLLVYVGVVLLLVQAARSWRKRIGNQWLDVAALGRAMARPMVALVRIEPATD